MAPHRDTRITRDANGRIRAYAGSDGRLRLRRVPTDTRWQPFSGWRLDTPAALRSTQRPTGTLRAAAASNRAQAHTVDGTHEG